MQEGPLNIFIFVAFFPGQIFSSERFPLNLAISFLPTKNHYTVGYSVFIGAVLLPVRRQTSCAHEPLASGRHSSLLINSENGTKADSPGTLCLERDCVQQRGSLSLGQWDHIYPLLVCCSLFNYVVKSSEICVIMTKVKTQLKDTT